MTNTRAPINILKAEFDNLRASQPQILYKPKNGDQDFESSAVSTIETIATTRSRLPRFRFGSSFGVYRKIFIMPNNSQSDHRVLIERRQTGPPDRVVNEGKGRRVVDDEIMISVTTRRRGQMMLQRLQATRL